jgi:hypothetical protein
MGQHEANITLIDDIGVHPLQRADKAKLAHEILVHTNKLMTGVDH